MRRRRRTCDSRVGHDGGCVTTAAPGGCAVWFVASWPFAVGLKEWRECHCLRRRGGLMGGGGLKGPVAIVRGASGSGRAAARRLFADGATVVVADVDGAGARHERVDMLFDNAGFFEPGEVHQATEAAWDRQLVVELRSVYLVSHHVARASATSPCSAGRWRSAARSATCACTRSDAVRSTPPVPPRGGAVRDERRRVPRSARQGAPCRAHLAAGGSRGRGTGT